MAPVDMIVTVDIDLPPPSMVAPQVNTPHILTRGREIPLALRNTTNPRRRAGDRQDEKSLCIIVLNDKLRIDRILARKDRIYISFVFAGIIIVMRKLFFTYADHKQFARERGIDMTFCTFFFLPEMLFLPST